MVLEGGEAVTIEVADVEIFSEDIPGWTVANEGSLTVALDITVTDALRVEGTARELVKRIQNLRKEKGFRDYRPHCRDAFPCGTNGQGRGGIRRLHLWPGPGQFAYGGRQGGRWRGHRLRRLHRGDKGR